MGMEYIEFLQTKKIKATTSGFKVDKETLNVNLFDHQKDIVVWALKKGKAALFAGTGLGKTIMQLEWANKVYINTGRNVLILAPLAVSSQTVREGEKFGISVNVCRHQEEVKEGINITNYEMLEHFNPDEFAGIVLDESSILKSFDSKYKQLIIDMFKDTPYKLACTATPAPNDHVELGNHSEFLNILSRVEMLATYFVHDGGDTSKWRLKGHAETVFWEWVASWAVVITKPSDLGYSDEGFELPPLNVTEIIVESPLEDGEGQLSLLPTLANTLTERRQARRGSLDNRVEKAIDLINNEQWLLWCDLNIESDMLHKNIDGSVEVKGSDKDKHKVKSAVDFSNGDLRILVSKASIFGFGLNFQSCHNMVFVGLSDSYEQLYQAIRRCWRFGQTQPVNVYIITSESEGAVKNNIDRKERESEKMIVEMVKFTQEILTKEIHGSHSELILYNPQIEMKVPEWLIEGGY
jgi:hypothetical protein